MAKSRKPLSAWKKKKRISPGLKRFNEERRNKKAEAGVPQKEAASSSRNQDSASTSHISDFAASTSGRSHDEATIKQERVKTEELILEDYGDPNEAMEYQFSENVAENEDIKQDVLSVSTASALPLCGTEGPFETIICGTSDVKIKQEIFEDEMDDAFGSSHEVERTPILPAPAKKESTELISNEIAQYASPTNSDSLNLLSKMTSKVRSLLNKNLEKIVTVKSSDKLMDPVPAVGSEKCPICAEFFTGRSNLLEHCNLKHPGTSSSFSPATEPSSTFELSSNKIPSLCEATAARSDNAAITPGYNEVITAGHSAATTPRVTNTPGQPPHQWTSQRLLPTEIPTCDICEAIFEKIPIESRKATIDKVLELVTFISEERINPALVNFSVIKM